MRKHVSFTEDFEGTDYELAHEPSPGSDILKAKVGDEVVIAYLVQDNDYRDVDDLMGDCMGRIVDAYNGGRDEKSELYALAGCDNYGEKNLDAIWGDHEDEAIKQYLIKIRLDYSFKEVREKLNDPELRSWDACIEALREDAYGANWGYVAFDEVMSAVLGEMWEDPTYYPGNRDAVMLDVYSHSGQTWSLSGGGMQCRWDTSHGAGAWVPDGHLLKELDSQAPQAAFAFVKNTSWLRGTGKSYQLVQAVWAGDHCNEIVHVEFSDDASALHAKAKLIAEMMGKPTPHQIAWGRERLCDVFAGQFLHQYNAVISGDIYGCVVETFDLDGTQTEYDACWGFIGGDYAEETLKDEYFDPACEGSLNRQEETTRSQGGRQMELL